MKLYIPVIIALLLVALIHIHSADPTHTEPIDIVQAEPIQTVQAEPKLLGTYTIYAYCPCHKCCGKTNSITASGTVATQGRTVASALPIGTKIYIDGIGERIVEDRGGAIGDYEIDLFMDSHAECLKFGIKKLKVYEIGVD